MIPHSRFGQRATQLDNPDGKRNQAFLKRVSSLLEQEAGKLETIETLVNIGES